jgi:hypothetical protein
LFNIECDVIGGMVVKSMAMRRVTKTIQRHGPYKDFVSSNSAPMTRDSRTKNNRTPDRLYSQT